MCADVRAPNQFIPTLMDIVTQNYWDLLSINITAKTRCVHLQYMIVIGCMYFMKYSACTSKNEHGDSCQTTLRTLWRPDGRTEGPTYKFINSRVLPLFQQLALHMHEFEWER